MTVSRLAIKVSNAKVWPKEREQEQLHINGWRKEQGIRREAGGETEKIK